VEWLEGVTSWPYLAYVAGGLALVAVFVSVVQTARSSELRRRVRRLEHRVAEAGLPGGPARPALSAGAGTSQGGRTRSRRSRDFGGDRAGRTVTDGAALPAPPVSWPTVEVPGPVVAAEADPVADTPLPVRTPAPGTRPEPAPTSARGAQGRLAAVAAMRGVTLLGRQLELLDDLEQREEEPEALAVLFQIDNLTMRLRRNAESALVLAGRESGRRTREPLSVTDVVRTACAQIESYERVSVEAVTDPVLRADVVVPLAHLLAEVLENATRFSDPESPVTVRVDRSEAGVVVAVADTGIGMDPAGLAEVRAQLADATPWSDGNRVGLVVISQLARRLDATVHVESAPGATTLTVLLPARLVVPDERATEAPRPEPLPGPVPAAEAVQEPVPGGAALPRRRSTAASHAALAGAVAGEPGGPSPAWAPTGAAVAGLGGGAARIAPAGGAPATDPDPAPTTPTPLPPPGPLDPAPSSAPPSSTTPSPALPSILPERPRPADASPPLFGRTSVAEPVEGAGPGTAPTTSALDDGWIVPQPLSPGLTPHDEPSMRDEVLAELGRLSGYRPARSDPESTAPLERRTSTLVAEPLEANRGPVHRDAADVRRRFSSFQSSVGRGRRR